MTALRRLAFPLRLAGVRLASHAGSGALLGLGIAAGACMLALVLGGSVVAQDESAARALARVPAGERALTVVYADLGLPRRGVDRRSLEPLVRRSLARLAPAAPTRVVQFKLLRVGASLVNLAAMDDVREWVRLRSGRFPEKCSPARCEVVQLEGGRAVPSLAGIRLVRVGEGRLVSPVPFGQLPGAEARLGESFGIEGEPPFVVAEGFDELAQLEALTSHYRTYAWIVPLARGDIHAWEIDNFAREAARVRSSLQGRAVNLALVAPVEELTAARAAGRVTGRRLLLIGGQVAALLLAFAVLAAAGMRRDVQALWQRLRWFGASRSQLALVSGLETGAVVLVGATAGWGLGAAFTALLAREADAPAAAVLAHSLFAPAGLAAFAGLTTAALAVLLLSLAAPTVSFGDRALSTLDVAALGALAAVGLALARGTADPRTVGAQGGTGTLLLLLPGLVTFVAAVSCARLLAPGLRLLGQGARGAAVPLRLAALSLARRPGHAAVAVAFLVVSLGLGLFAAAYRSTLSHGLEDQATYALPLEFALREKLSPDGLVAPLEAAPLARYRALAGEATVPVIRQRGSVSPVGTRDSVTLLGVPPGKLELLHGWRADFSELSLNELAKRMRGERAVALRGAEIPPGATALALPVSVVGGDLFLEAAVLTRRGDVAFVDLGTTDGTRVRTLRAPIPQRARGGRLFAFTLIRAATVEGHGTDFERVDGTLTLGPLAADVAGGRRVLVSDYAPWVGTDNVDATVSDGRARLRYLITGSNFAGRFRPRQSTDESPIPAVVSPRLAAAADADGLLPLHVPSGRITVRVVAEAHRFPTAYGDFILVDERLAFVALNTVKPGAAAVNEIWLGVPAARRAAVRQALSNPPFNVLSVRSQSALEQSLRSDPLARGSLATLATAALVALVLALAGLLFVVVSDIRDERGELFDLEAQGAAPATLRRHVRLRACLVTALGVLGGIATGAVLSALVVDLVALTANATAPEPPLVLRLDFALVGLALAAYAALAAALVSLATRRGYRLP